MDFLNDDELRREIEELLKQEPIPEHLDFNLALEQGNTEQASAIALMSIAAALFTANDLQKEQLVLSKESTANVQKTLGDSLNSVLKGNRRGPEKTQES